MITHTTTHTYDPDYGFVTAIQTASVQDLHFDYYNESNEPQQNIQSRTHFGLQETFSYDNANRLTGSVVEQHDPIVVDYDANGNIQYKSNVGTYDYTSSSDEYPNPYAVKGITNPPTGVDEIERLELSYTPFNKIESILQTTGNKTAEFTYGPDEQRRKMVLKENGTDYKTTYYVGAYEKEITPEGVRELHYIGGSAVYVINSDGNSDMYYIYKDHLGSITDITDHEGTVIESLSYDAWGNRRNPDTWEYDNNLQNFLFDRGFTGHACAERSRSKHLDDFAIINMNGRIYDPLTGRMMAPDNYVQSSLSQNLNRYSYCMNNPLVYTDPSGEIAWFVPIIIGAAVFGTGNLTAHAIKGDVNNFNDGLKYFGQGALAGAALGAAWQFAPLIPGIGQGLQTGMTIYGKVHMWGTAVSAGSGLLQGAFTGDWSALGNAGEIFLGNFYLDENRNVLGGTWQGFSRHTWEFLQTGLGHSIGQLRNTFGGIDDVDYFGGATLMNKDDNSGHMWGFTLGSFINSKNLDVEDEMFRHEYGHTLQGQRWGVLYPFVIGIPSAISSNFSSNEKHLNRWYEKGANRYGERYYRKYLPNNLTLTPWDDIRYPRH